MMNSASLFHFLFDKKIKPFLIIGAGIKQIISDSLALKVFNLNRLAHAFNDR